MRKLFPDIDLNVLATLLIACILATIGFYSLALVVLAGTVLLIIADVLRPFDRPDEEE